jgi:hypothetical protein
MTRALSVAIAAAVMLPACFAPRFSDGQIRCTQDSSCPPDYHCALATQTCYGKGHDPVLDLGSPDTGSVPADSGADTFTDDSRTCSSDGDCANGYCSLVGTCFHANTAPARCPKFALFCDDFEGAARLPWGAAVAGGSVAPPAGASVIVDGNNGFHGASGTALAGAHSLHVIAPGTPQQPGASVYWVERPYLLPTPISVSTTPTTVAVRGYVFAAAKFQEQPYFFQLHRHGNADGFNIGAVNGTSSANANWSVYNKRSQSYAFADPNSSAIGAGRWYCVEVVLTLQSVAGTLTNTTDFYVDNVLLNHTSVSAPNANDTIDELDVGITWSQSSQPNEYDLDDIALATQRIFCE